MITSDQALDRLMHASRENMFEMCCDAHKDQYGVKGRHFSTYNKLELVNWFVSHYQWDEEGQYWNTIVPFDEEIYNEELYSSKEDEYDYYRQFG